MHVDERIAECKEKSENWQAGFDKYSEAMASISNDWGAGLLLSKLVNSDFVGQMILDCSWSIIEIVSEFYEFLCSDRPIIMSNGMKE